VSGSFQAPAALSQGKNLGIHRRGSWVCLRRLRSHW